MEKLIFKQSPGTTALLFAFGIRKVTNIQIHAPSCILHVHVPACTVLYCRAQRKRERGRKERGEREGERRRKKFGRQGRPAKAFWKNLKLKTRAPEQYDHREYCSGALVFNFKYPYRADSAKKVDLQSGTVRDSPGHQLS